MVVCYTKRNCSDKNRQKKKKKKIMLFVLRKGRSKYAEQNKPWTRYSVLLKIGVWALFALFEKTSVVSITFRLR